METADILAKFWAWLGLILAVIYLSRPKLIAEMKRMVVDDRTFSILYALIALFMGLASLIIYSEWSLSWRVVITIFGWLSLLKGVAILVFFPGLPRKVPFEARLQSTRIIMVFVGIFSAWVLWQAYNL